MKKLTAMEQRWTLKLSLRPLTSQVNPRRYRLIEMIGKKKAPSHKRKIKMMDWVKL